ncbi:MAG: nuclear transport factor 2 family protein [Acidimicrobiia bacterium]|nr:nuclear transport factor 2 family protein [Acidimicrobiia bacterium]
MTAGATGATTTDEIAVVLGFLAALERLDVDGAAELLDESVVYQNVPLPPARGRTATVGQLQSFMRFSDGFEVVTHNIAANGPVVLTERTDVFVIGGGRASFWVCGTFEVHDGKITLWRDRFDFVDFTVALTRGLAGAAIARLRAR